MSKSRYQTIEDLFGQIQPKSAQTTPLQDRWQHWKHRFEVYEDLNNGKYLRFFRLQEDRKLIYQEEKLTAALNALNDFYQHDLQTTNPEIESELLRMVDIELLKIEIRQFKKLAKIQLLERENLKAKIDELKDKRKQSRESIQIKLFSEKFKDVNATDLTAYLQDHEKNKTTPALLNYLKYHESKFHFGKHIERADYAASGVRIASSSVFSFNFVNTIRALFEPLASPLVDLGGAMASFATAVPIISSIVSAVPILFNAGKAWFRNKSTAKKIILTLASIVAVAGVVASIAFLGLGMLAFGGIIATILAAVGFAAVCYYPWINAARQVKATKAEIAAVNDRIDFLKRGPISNLTDGEKDILLKKLEEICIISKYPNDDTNVKQAKQLITDGKNIDALTANPIVKMMLGRQELKEFLIDKNKAKVAYLQNQLVEQEKDGKEKLMKMVNGAFAVAGLALLCIPTPPTIIIGSILLVATTIVGIGIKYNWGEKIMNLAKKVYNWFSKKPDEDSVEMQTFKPTKSATPYIEPANDKEFSPPKPGVAPSRDIAEKPLEKDDQNVEEKRDVPAQHQKRQ